MIVLTVVMAVFFTILAVPAQSRNHRRPSPADCDAYARNYAERYSGSLIGGTARGAVGGALFGAVVGGKKGAKRGAVLGGAVGGVKRATNRDHIRRQAYDDCMSGRVRW